MTSSPMLHPHPHSIPHTPLSTSPTASPILRPLASSMARSSSGSITPLRLSSPAPATLPRNFGRPPTVRPYQSALCARAGVSGRNVRDVEGDSKEFGDLVFDMIERRGRKTRAGELGAGDEDGRKSKSLGGSLAGSWEKERAELIVDIPVWSPGCFQGGPKPHYTARPLLTSR